MKDFFFDSRKLYYRMNDFQEGRETLVFVHGLSGSSSAWLPYEKKFEQTFNILSLDMRGHGKSEKPRSYNEYKIEYFADDLATLVDHLNIKNFILVGHSLGAFVVLEFLRRHQGKVSKVVFLAPHFSVRNMMSAKIIRPLLTIALPFFRYLPFSGKGRGHIDYSRYPNSGDWNIPRMIADIRNTSLRVYLYATRQSYDFDAEGFLQSITIPTLIIHGERDTIFPVQYGALMAQKITGAKLVVYKNTDHILVLNNTREICEEIEKFVQNSTK